MPPPAAGAAAEPLLGGAELGRGVAEAPLVPSVPISARNVLKLCFGQPSDWQGSSLPPLTDPSLTPAPPPLSDEPALDPFDTLRFRRRLLAHQRSAAA